MFQVKDLAQYAQITQDGFKFIFPFINKDTSLELLDAIEEAIESYAKQLHLISDYVITVNDNEYHLYLFN